MYASYFEKDQVTLGPAAIGHTHDWEHVIVWINNNEVKYVSASQHSGYQTLARSEIRFDGTHPKIVYHKDGIGSHCFRFANGNDERRRTPRATGSTRGSSAGTVTRPVTATS